MAVAIDGVSAADSEAVDVAQAAALTGLSKAAIRGRIRRGALASDVQDGRHRIPLAELQSQDLLVEAARYTSALEQAESLESELRAALESREQAQQELRELRETLRMVWGMVRQMEQEISHPENARAERRTIRWPWLRRPWRRSASPATDSA
jgi:chromosome segregation ATPase